MRPGGFFKKKKFMDTKKTIKPGDTCRCQTSDGIKDVVIKKIRLVNKWAVADWVSVDNTVFGATTLKSLQETN